MAKIKFADLNPALAGVRVQDLIDQGMTVNGVPEGAGLMNTEASTESYGYNVPPGAMPIAHAGAYITLGAVPPEGLASGYSAQGAASPTIDLVVGRNASSFGGKGLSDGYIVDNNFGTDAARIYISRLTDVDKYFSLAKREGSEHKNSQRSAVAVKADNVRLIGREGVKIVTGKMQGGNFGPHGETNSLGGRIESPAPKIELIAGNNYDNVQGLALGETTRDSLRELHDILQDLWSAVYNFIMLQTAWDAVIGVSPFPWYPAGAAPKSMGNMSMVMSSLYSTKINLMLWDFNSLNPAGNQYIVSRNVRSN